MSSRKNKICLVKNPKLHWEGASDEDSAKLVKFGIGEVVEFTYTAIRSYLNLQRYFVMVKIGFDNQEEYTRRKLWKDHKKDCEVCNYMPNPAPVSLPLK